MAENWHEVWKDFSELNFFGKILSRAHQKMLKKISQQFALNARTKVLDVGCGYGETLLNLRVVGLTNSIGIDNSENALRLCMKRNFLIGQDIFLMDATDMKFADKNFDLVISHGMLEHFKGTIFKEMIQEMCRVSRKYVVIFQPNHFSMFNKFMLATGRRPVKEFSYSKLDFINEFERFDFAFKKDYDINFGEEFVLMFERVVK
jgi:SAM-dependent methyltransferase